MEPTEPTAESLQSFDSQGQPAIRRQLMSMVAQVTALVPTLTGLSITKVDAGVPLTLVATTPSVLPLDAIQYLDGGPLVEAVAHGSLVVTDETDPLNEDDLSAFARASAVQGVRASLSLPLLEADAVIGSVNVYASNRDAFEDRVQQIADIVGAWAPGAVRDSDLTFSSRLAAFETSAELDRRERLVDRAVAIIARLKGLAAEEARRSLRESAARAGVEETEVAHTIVVFHDP